MSCFSCLQKCVSKCLCLEIWDWGMYQGLFLWCVLSARLSASWCPQAQPAWNSPKASTMWISWVALAILSPNEIISEVIESEDKLQRWGVVQDLISHIKHPENFTCEMKLPHCGRGAREAPDAREKLVRYPERNASSGWHGVSITLLYRFIWPEGHPSLVGTQESNDITNGEYDLIFHYCYSST